MKESVSIQSPFDFPIRRLAEELTLRMDSPPVHSTSRNRVGLALVVATRGRVEYLHERFPIWAAAKFDEVVIADNSVEPADRARTESLCASYGFAYLPIPPRLRDQRSRARNLAIAAAHQPWILNQDDDDEIVEAWDRRVLEEAARHSNYLFAERGTQMLALESGQMPMLFRRDLFLRVGGYPEFLAGGEDQVMIRKFRTEGVAGVYDASRLWTSIRRPPRVAAAHPLSLVRNMFWYHVGLLSLLSIVTRRKRFVRGFVRDNRNFVLDALHRRAGIALAASGVLAVASGLFLSPFHLLLHRRELASLPR